MTNTLTTNKQPSIFPKLFIAAAKTGFENFLRKHNSKYQINYISCREDLISLIETYSHYKNYMQPVIISDISFLNKSDQSLLLKFIDDSHLNIILLASRDNILDTIVSRVKEFRKFYIFNNSNKAGFFSIEKARDMAANEMSNIDSLSYDDKLLLYNKYNSMLAYDDYLVRKYNQSDRKKLLNILELNDE